MFAQRASQRPNGEFYEHEPVPDPEQLTKAGAKVINTREPQLAAGGAFYVSGEIPRLTRYEVGLPGHCTGWRALTAMAKIFGDELVPTAVGKKYRI